LKDHSCIQSVHQYPMKPSPKTPFALKRVTNQIANLKFKLPKFKDSRQFVKKIDSF